MSMRLFPPSFSFRHLGEKRALPPPPLFLAGCTTVTINPPPFSPLILNYAKGFALFLCGYRRDKEWRLPLLLFPFSPECGFLSTAFPSSPPSCYRVLVRFPPPSLPPPRAFWPPQEEFSFFLLLAGSRGKVYSFPPPSTPSCGR